MLPEKWFVKRNKANYQVLNQWEHDIRKGNAHRNAEGYFFSDRAYTTRARDVPSNYIEITFEDFKYWVLGIGKPLEEEETSYEIF